MATSVLRKSIALFAFSIMLLMSVAVFSDTYTTSQAEFNQGTYTNTLYNTGTNSIQANASTGTYTSKIIDAGQLTNWYQIAWSSSAYGSLADNQQIENFATNNVDMSGNTMLFHLDDTLTNNANVKDSSGNNNNATFHTNDASKSTAGKINNAINFDGSDYATLPEGVANYNFTISMWFKSSATNKYLYGETLQDQLGTSYILLAFLSSGKLTARYFDSDDQCIGEINSTSAFNDNSWHNVVFSRRNSTYTELYIDGQLNDISSIKSNTVSNCGYKQTDNANIGARGSGSSSFDFQGSLDDVAIWSKPLSAQEINSIFTRGSKNLNLKIRSCDDSLCSGESFSALTGQSPQTINQDNRYFQYQFDFSSSTTSVDLYNVTLQYDSPPTVSLSSPANNFRTLDSNLTLSCSATDNNAVINTTLYTDISGTWRAEAIGTSSISQAFTSVADGNYTWNCLSYDNNNRFAWGTARNVNAAFDKDLDTVPDSEDSLEGSSAWVKTTGISNLQATINGNSTYGTFNGNNEMKFFDGNELLMSFTHDFSPLQEIDLSKVIINSTSTFFNVDLGSQLLANESKTIYMPNNLQDICVKDSADPTITANCTGLDEIDFTPCIGNTTGIVLNGRNCIDTGSRLMISNLKHTAVRITPSVPVPGSSGSSSSGDSSSSGGGSARPNSWQKPSQTVIGDASASEIAAAAARMREAQKQQSQQSSASSPKQTTKTAGNSLTGNIIGGSGKINWKTAMFTFLGLILMAMIALGLRIHYYGKKEKPFDPFEESFIQKIKNRFNNL